MDWKIRDVYKDEIRDNFLVTASRKKVWQVELELLEIGMIGVLAAVAVLATMVEAAAVLAIRLVEPAAHHIYQDI